MLKQTRLIIAGGFLGAGKTTLLWEVARRLTAQGLRVGLITNDQASELVDSAWLKQAHLKVAEVSGSCFCCNFNAFVDAIRTLRADEQADVILAEPVGSCADLMATIVRPMKIFHNTEVVVSPLTVLSDPSRLESILYGGNGGLHDDAAYIYRKQLEESEVILITKTDLLSDEKLQKLIKDTKTVFHDSKVMAASVLNGTGLKEWFGEISGSWSKGMKVLDINYDRYAHGEAVLGWLNGTVALTCENARWDALLKNIMDGFVTAIESENLGVGHIKVIVESGSQCAVGNLVGAASTLQLRGTAGTGNSAKLIVNARVETSPRHLDEIVKAVLANAFNSQYKDEILAWKCLMPGRPSPTSRML